MQPNNQSEVDKFFSGLPTENGQAQNVFDTNVEPPVDAPIVPAKDEEGSEARKNRRHRRLEEQLQRERESNIALNERVKALAEARNDSPVSAGQMPSEWIALYGDTPESQKAWAIQERMFKNLKDQAKQEALQEFENQQQEVVKKQKEYESYIDTELEALEDQFDIDLTSDAPSARKSRREFLELVQSISPKDGQGNITGYADFESTFELYQKTKSQDAKPTTLQRQKDLASASMQPSAPNGGDKPREVTPGFFGWRKDLGL